MCSPLECSGFPWQLLLTNGSHGFHGSSLGFAGVVSLPTPQTGHKSPHRAEFGFLSRTNSPLPLKGEGLDIACLGFVESALLVHNWGTLAQQGRSGGFAGVVSLPRPLTGHKSPYRAEFGFGLLAGDSEKDHPPFQQSRVSNRAEEKKSLPCF